MGPRTVLFMAVIVAAIVFCGVQDRVTAAGARRYVDLQQAAAQGRGARVTVDEVMRPVVRQSVAAGSAWGAVVLAAGAVLAGTLRFVVRDR
jgi:hypothetical protein